MSKKSGASRREGGLMRDPRDSFLFGVCGALARYVGLDAWKVRVIAVVALIFFTLPTVIIYGVLALILDKRQPIPENAGPQERRFYRDMYDDPTSTVRSMGRWYDDLDGRLRRLERQVTSSDFVLRQKFRDLENDDRAR